MASCRLGAGAGQKRRGAILVVAVLLRIALAGLSAVLAYPALAQSAGPAFPAAQRPDQPEISSRQISGRVIDETGRPLPNASIKLALVGEFSSAGRRDTATGLAGDFRIEDVGDGVYILSASAHGYVADTSGDITSFADQFVRPGETREIRLLKGGAITGIVRDGQGEAIVEMRVRALPYFGSRAQRMRSGNTYESITDDRGVYRIYGLPAGSYVVSAGGASYAVDATQAHAESALAFHPSGGAATAAEVVVRVGEEVSGIDVRYVAVDGFTVSGAISSVAKQTSDWSNTRLVLASATTGVLVAEEYAGDRTFSIANVPDGEYVLSTDFVDKDGRRATASRRVIVKGADVKNADLILVALGRVEGVVRLVGERPIDCEPTPASVASTLIALTPLATSRAVDSADSSLEVPNAAGEFAVNVLDVGTYHLSVQPPGANTYVKSVTTIAAGKPSDKVVGEGLTVAAGKLVSPVQIVLAPGAARVYGRATSTVEGAKPLSMTYTYLIPDDPTEIDNALRYYRSVVKGDGAFEIANVAPGKYLLVAFAARDTPNASEQTKFFAPTASERGFLRRASDVNRRVIKLRPCENARGVTISVSDITQDGGTLNAAP